jgi:hypothetical protein
MAAAKAAQRAGGAGQPAVSAQAKLQWLEIVASDAKAASAARAAIILATKYINRETGEAWPSLDTLAKDLGANRKTAVRALNSLVARGHLAKEPGGGRRRSNTYRLRFSAQNGDETVPGAGTISSPKQGQNCPPNPRKGRVPSGGVSRAEQAARDARFS